MAQVICQNLQGTLTASVDVLLLLVEQIVTDGDFTLVPEQTQQYEQFPVMHAYFGDTPANAIAPLRIMQTYDTAGSLWQKPTVDPIHVLYIPEGACAG
jgi:hypothetical protein